MNGPEQPRGDAPSDGVPDETTGSVPAARPGRRRLALAAASVVAIAVVVLVVVLGRGEDGVEPTADQGASSSAPSSSAAAPPSGTDPGAATTSAPVGTSQPAPDPNQPPTTLAPVALGDRATAGDGVTATVTAVEPIDGQAVGPGNVAGPALRVTVQLANDTDTGVSLDGVDVNMVYGADLTPASPLDDPSRAPFTGEMPPGGRAAGVYVFSVPADARDAITVQVGYRAGAPILAFTGSAS